MLLALISLQGCKAIVNIFCKMLSSQGYSLVNMFETNLISLQGFVKIFMKIMISSQRYKAIALWTLMYYVLQFLAGLPLLE